MRKVSLDEYKYIVLGIMVKIDEICQENNIPYYLSYGTLLGGVRHKGFIPWDDDFDILMKRSDYDRLAEILDDGNYGLNFIRIETRPDTLFPYGKICDQNTILEERNFCKLEEYGAFIDVFPLDYLPNNKKKQLDLKKRHLILVKMITHNARLKYTKTSSWRLNCKRIAAIYFSKMFSRNKLINIINKEQRKLNETKTNYLGISWDIAFPAEQFDGYSLVEFEGHKFKAPINPDAMLRSLYGNYMELPPIDQRVGKHSITCYYKENDIV